jgi:hypothetical protein
MWTFEIFKADFTARLTKDGILVSSDCYSGSKSQGGFNNPDKVAEHNVGPLPEGFWRIVGPPYTDGKHGPYVLNLVPEKSVFMYGRDLFRVHGKPLPPKDINDGSDGCICADHVTRVRLYQSGDIKLLVKYS